MQPNQVAWNNMRLVCGAVTISALSLPHLYFMYIQIEGICIIWEPERRSRHHFIALKACSLSGPHVTSSVFSLLVASVRGLVNSLTQETTADEIPRFWKNPQICFSVTRHGNWIMASICPGSIIHYPFLKINPKHFNFDTAEVWPELHCDPILCQSDTQMYRIYFTSIFICCHVHIIQEPVHSIFAGQ